MADSMGAFITIEGGEGAGKSTQARLLAGKLESVGLQVVVTREPGGTAFAEQLRDVLLGDDGAMRSPAAEALAFYAARLDHLELVIRPALHSGVWVICDRFSDSTRVYQGVAGKVSPAFLDQLEALVVAPTSPDVTIILDLDPAEGLRRALERRGAAATIDSDRYEGRDLAYHRELREGFLAIGRADGGRCVVIDGSRGPEAIAADVWQLVSGRLIGEG